MSKQKVNDEEIISINIKRKDIIISEGFVKIPLTSELYFNINGFEPIDIAKLNPGETFIMPEGDEFVYLKEDNTLEGDILVMKNEPLTIHSIDYGDIYYGFLNSDLCQYLNTDYMKRLRKIFGKNNISKLDYKYYYPSYEYYSMYNTDFKQYEYVDLYVVIPKLQDLYKYSDAIEGNARVKGYLNTLCNDKDDRVLYIKNDIDTKPDHNDIRLLSTGEKIPTICNPMFKLKKGTIVYT